MKRISILLMVMVLAVLCVGLLAAGCGSTTSTTASSTATASSEASTTTGPPTTVASTTTEVGKVYKIGVTQIVTHPDLDASRKAFIAEMTKLGYVEGKNVTYEINNPEGDMTLAASIAKKFVADGVDLIYTLTTPSAQAAAEAAKDSKIPIVFSNVTDPVAAGIVNSWEKSGVNICGASDWCDVSVQMKQILEIVPTVKTVGIIYNAGETNSVVQVDAIKKINQSLGFSVVEATAATSADVLLAMQSLVGRCDAVWFPTDNVMASAVSVLVKVCEENKLPLFGSSPLHVDGGAIAAVGVDEEGEGRQAAIMADKVLKGANPADMAVYKQPTDLVVVNPGAAERMGITIPESVMSKATRVVTESTTTTGG